jgi:hypothetical protein
VHAVCSGLHRDVQLLSANGRCCAWSSRWDRGCDGRSYRDRGTGGSFSGSLRAYVTPTDADRSQDRACELGDERLPSRLSVCTSVVHRRNNAHEASSLPA